MNDTTVVPANVITSLDAMLAAGQYAELESECRRLMRQHRFYIWHLYLIVSLLRRGMMENAGIELDYLFTYKFNIAERAGDEIKRAFPEKFSEHYILDTMKKGTGIENAGESIRRRWNVAYPLDYMDKFATEIDKLVAECVPVLPPIPRDAKIATFGSCFAANLARMLRDAGANASNLLIEETINSPLANRSFLWGLVDGDYDDVPKLRATYGDEFLTRARKQLMDAEVIVLTFGVAPAFFYTDSGKFAFLEDYPARLADGTVVMRTPTVEETKIVIRNVLELIRAMNQDARLYVSISPVPLMGTAELSSAITADCLSKSTLRAALSEASNEFSFFDKAHYWPSFEIVRWLGAHTTLASYGEDDHVSRHVSNWLVELIVQRFTRHLFGTT